MVWMIYDEPFVGGELGGLLPLAPLHVCGQPGAVVGVVEAMGEESILTQLPSAPLHVCGQPGAVVGKSKRRCKYLKW